MGRRLPFYVPDSESRNFPKRLSYHFILGALAPLGVLHCQETAGRYFLKAGFITGFGKTLSFSFIVLTVFMKN